MQRKLKIGAVVRTQLVPVYAILQVGNEIKMPAPPKVGIKSAAGHTEYKDAPQDSPEWAAYSEQVSQLSAQIQERKSDFTFDYAVEAWSWDDGNTWQTEPPDSWQFPEIFKRHGLKPSENKRVDYIRYKLLILNEDMAIVQGDALGQAMPITNQEVGAALGGFRGDAQGDDPDRNTA